MNWIEFKFNWRKNEIQIDGESIENTFMVFGKKKWRHKFKKTHFHHASLLENGLNLFQLITIA
jgi:hypothetical protein